MTKQEYFKTDNSHYFFDDAKAIAAYCRKNCKKDVEHILRIADEVSRNYFLFDLKWDMERTYEPVIFEKEIDWEIIPAGDKEFVWQFNRHRFFICLGQAYQLTGNEKYAQTFVRLLTDWITRVTLVKEREDMSWRSLEAGLRGEYWTKAMRYFQDSPAVTDEVIDMFCNSLIQHAEYLISKHSEYKYMSNWGVLENHGLFEIAMSIPDRELKKRYADIAIEHLEVEARMEIMNDGVQWEQSPMYHNEVFQCYMDVLILAARNGVTLPDSITERVRKMAYADLAWIKPDGCQFIFGDSDDTDIRDLVSQAAWIFRDPVLKSVGLSEFDFDTIWNLGIAAAEEYKRMDAVFPSYQSVALENSGNFFMRSGWDEKANLMHFHCGTLGAGHGHSDKLHMNLVMKGRDILVDSGRYTYVVELGRFQFKDPEAHNTITVDGEKFTVCKDSWECSRLSQPVNTKFVSTANYDFTQGGHLGYMYKGVFVNRKIIYIKPDIYIVADEIYAPDELHSYQQYFHFNEAGSVKVEGRKAVYADEAGAVEMFFLNEDMELALQKGEISRHYNLKTENDVIRTNIVKAGTTTGITVIADADKRICVEKLPVKSALKNRYYNDKKAEAVKVVTGDKKEYVVIICHEEVNSPTDMVEADDCKGFGNVIVFEKDVDTYAGNVMLW